MTDNSGHVWRVDKFVVPTAARDELLARVDATRAILRRQPGFLGDKLLEQSPGPGEFNIVTIAHWKGQAHIEAAREAVVAEHRRIGFEPQEMLQRLGIRADLANYRELEGGVRATA